MKNRRCAHGSFRSDFARLRLLFLLPLLTFLLWSTNSSAIVEYSEQLSEDGAAVLVPGGGNTKIPDHAPANAEISSYCSYCKQYPLTKNTKPGSAGSGANTPGQGFGEPPTNH